MPIYEYRCKKCNTQFELLNLSEEDNEITCPECGCDQVKKLLSSGIFAGRLNMGGCGPSSSGGFS